MKTGITKTKTAARSPKRSGSPEGVSQTKILDFASKIDVMQFMDYRDFLAKLYESLKTTRKSYSYAKFSSAIGLSESNVIWQVLTHRRDLSEASAEKMSESLKFSFEKKKHFLLLVKHNNSRNPTIREACMNDLIQLRSRFLNDESQEQTLEYYEEWYNPVLREMIGLDDFQNDPDWINDRLFMKITPKRIEKSMLLLQKLELICFDSDRKRLVLTDKQVFPDRKVKALASIRYHQKACEIARESVTAVASHRRDLNVLTLCASEKSILAMKEIIHEAGRKLMEMERNEMDKEHLYQINLQVFSLTK
ncbi:MAG: TIGR02147 family protein [Oligoflexus sp.]|nr:TIGR02147 family protein [Oligoflexus sp.]